MYETPYADRTAYDGSWITEPEVVSAHTTAWSANVAALQAAIRMRRGTKFAYSSGQRGIEGAYCGWQFYGCWLKAGWMRSGDTREDTDTFWYGVEVKGIRLKTTVGGVATVPVCFLLDVMGDDDWS